jgi:hypothetical protein
MLEWVKLLLTVFVDHALLWCSAMSRKSWGVMYSGELSGLDSSILDNTIGITWWCAGSEMKFFSCWNCNLVRNAPTDKTPLEHLSSCGRICIVMCPFVLVHQHGRSFLRPLVWQLSKEIVISPRSGPFHWFSRNTKQ